MTIYEIKEKLENDFIACGDYVCLDKDDWKDYVDSAVIEAYENGTLTPNFEDKNYIEFCMEDIAQVECKANGFELIDYVVDQVFDSPGLDVFVASFVIAEGEDEVVSYHNVYNRC